MTSEGSFSGKVFLVTGASSGIGEAVVTLLASRGASVTLCGRDEDRLDSVRQKCVTESGGHTERFITVHGDLRQADNRKRVVQATVEKFGKLDALVPNAGVGFSNGGLEKATEEDYDEIMDTNTKAVFFLIQEAVSHLEQSKGCIVCVSSILSTTPVGFNVVYPMSKAAVECMVKNVAVQLAPKGIRVNSVSPSYVLTRMDRYAGDEATVKKLQDFISAAEIQHHPLEGRLVTVTEVAEAILFLASDKASFITDQCLQVDGGRHFYGPPNLQ